MKTELILTSRERKLRPTTLTHIYVFFNELNFEKRLALKAILKKVRGTEIEKLLKNCDAI